MSPADAMRQMVDSTDGPDTPPDGDLRAYRRDDRGWMSCAACRAPLCRREVGRNLMVCPRCQHHHPVPAVERIAQLVDAGTFREWSAELQTCDPLGFHDPRPYAERVADEQARTGLREAAVVGEGLIRGSPVAVGVVAPGFLRGSMGSVVGEKLARAIEGATERRWPLVLVVGSAGARMHEGAFSLMQMAKVAAALGRHRAGRAPSIGVLTDPSIGGVLGLASLGDVVLAEPGARVGFVGPRVLAQTTGIRMPEGVQTSESALRHGFVDRVAPRRHLGDLIALLLDYLSPPPACRHHRGRLGGDAGTRLSGSRTGPIDREDGVARRRCGGGTLTALRWRG